MIVNGFDILGLAVRSQPHHLILAGIDLESSEVREGRVKQPKGVRKYNLPKRRETVPFSSPGRGCSPLADSVDTENGGLFKGRGVKRGGGVRFVVFSKKNRWKPGL